MHISKHISKGSQHKVYCEDFLFEEELNEEYTIYGVLDGCSSGINSHFASSLIAKTVINEAKKIDFGQDIDFLKQIIYQTIISLKTTKELLNLSVNELLSTMIIMLIDTIENKADIVSIGDGVIVINDEIIDIDQLNKPDYIAYHLDEINSYDDFEIFYGQQLIFDNTDFNDITISTDGINSFSYNSNEPEFNVIEYFAKDDFLMSNPAMLSRKHNILRNKYSLENADDIAIIRIKKSVEKGAEIKKMKQNSALNETKNQENIATENNKKSIQSSVPITPKLHPITDTVYYFF